MTVKMNNTLRVHFDPRLYMNGVGVPSIIKVNRRAAEIFQKVYLMNKCIGKIS